MPGAFGVGHAAPTLTEQHLLWAAFAPRGQAARSWSALTERDGLDGLPPSMHSLMALIAANLADEVDLPYAGHLAGYRRRTWVTVRLAEQQLTSVLDHMEGSDLCVAGDLLAARAYPPGTRPVDTIMLWAPNDRPGAVAGRLGVARDAANGPIVISERGPVPVVIVTGPLPYMGPPVRRLHGGRWWECREPLPIGDHTAWALAPTEALAHLWVGMAWRSDRALAAADVHQALEAGGVDLERLVELVDQAGALGALRTSLPYLASAFGGRPYEPVDQLCARRSRTAGEQAVRWLDRSAGRLGPAPRSLLGYLALVPPGTPIGRHAVEHLRLRRGLTRSGPIPTTVSSGLGRMWRRPAHDIDRVLLGVAQSVVAPGLVEGIDVGRVDTDELFRRIEWHRLAGVARTALDEPSVPGPLADRLRLVHHGARRAHLATLAELRIVDEALDVPFLVVKGPVLAAMYGDGGARSYADLDVLVGDDGFASAQTALVRAGYRPLRDPDDNDRRFAQVPYGRPGGVQVDLHRSLLSSQHRRLGSGVAPAALLARGVDVDLGGSRYRTLDPADTVVHLAVHGARSGADRLVWLVDLALALRTLDVDGTEIADRASAWRATSHLVFMAERLAAAGLAPPGDEPLSGSAAPRGFRYLARAMVALFPVERTGGRLSPARHVAVNARPTALATVGAVFMDRARRARGMVVPPPTVD